MRNPFLCIGLPLVLSAVFPSSAASQGFALLKNGNRTAQVILPDGENKALQYAADDLLADLARIAGQTTTASLDTKVIIGSVSELGDYASKPSLADPVGQLRGKREAYRVFVREDRLYILGSDTRGTMWGIYQFAERYLGIDPMYLWTDKAPSQRDQIILKDVSLASDGPTFKYRGWFINDEDFLTEWKPFDGRRNNDYKYYARIMHPDVSDRVIETALRLRMNMIIPSSFNDVLNPPEAYAVNKAAERGLIVTQHHIEPLGVGGFNFDDYFERREEKPPLFSFFKHSDEMQEVWEEYVKAWAEYPDVVWQLGLRGRGDRAIWTHDPSIPKDAASRGAIISEAIRFQYNLVRKHDQDGVMTLTLWSEST